MMPHGLGIDLVEISRIQRMLDEHGQRTLQRLLTSSESEYCSRQAVPARHVAARVAAKEAAFKALSASGDAEYVGWQEFEVSRSIDGRPSLLFHGRGLDRAKRLRVQRALLSITHTDTYAAAVVALFG